MSYSEEEKETIEHLIDMSNLSLIGDGTVIVQNETIATVLNLIQKQEKIIDKMAEKMVEDKDWFYSEFDNYTKQDFIEYFKKVVDEDVKD